MPTDQLRYAQTMTQTLIAAVFELDCDEISRIENDADSYVQTLRANIEAMGGTLRIAARFPDGAVEITQFQMQDSAA